MRTVTDVIEFVLLEVARFVERINTLPLREVFGAQDDGLFTLSDDDDGRAMYVIGRKAESELRTFCEKELASRGYSGRIDLAALLRQFKREIAIRFIKEAHDLNDDEAFAAFAAAFNASLARVKNRAHYIPCRLVVASDPDTVSFGPVVFIRTDTAWPEIASALDTHFVDADHVRQSLRTDVERYYSEFPWIAKVEVTGCEPIPSYEVALQMAQTALDGLQLLLGGSRVHRMSVGGVAVGTDVRSHLVFEDGIIESVRVTHHSTGVGMGIRNETWKQVDDEPVARLRHLIGLVVNYAYATPEPTPFALRMADALHWFGLAARDTSTGAKLVMFLTAVERLLSPRKGRIESDVRNRSLIFCAWDKHGTRTTKLYTVRGARSHGKISPRSTTVAEAAWMAQEFAEQVLIGMLRQCEEVIHRSEQSSDELGVALDDAYQQFQKAQGSAAAERSNLALK